MKKKTWARLGAMLFACMLICSSAAKPIYAAAPGANASTEASSDGTSGTEGTEATSGTEASSGTEATANTEASSSTDAGVNTEATSGTEGAEAGTSTEASSGTEASSDGGDASSGGEGGGMGGMGGGDAELASSLSVGSDTTQADTFEAYCKIAVAVLAVIILLSLILVIVKVKKAKKAGKAQNIIMSIISILLVVVICVAQWATTTYANSVSALFTKTIQSTKAADTDATDWKNLVYQIANEGMVLLTNENETLPLATGTKVNLIGYYAYNPFYSGSGSGSVSAADAIDIASGLRDAGLDVNPAVANANLYPIKEAQDSGIGFTSTTLSIDEVASSAYTGDVSFENMKAYSDTAIYVIGRTGGEGIDLTKYDGNYLTLSDNERDMLKKICDTFDKVIVVINSANTVEMGFADEFDIDAIIWSGEPGPYGFESLGQIIAGQVNPSGRLADTWVYDNDSAAAMENFGEQTASNAASSYYVDYVEGIYVGYKWYETAYAEKAVITNTKTKETFDFGNYESVVKYPFGYGLSYSSYSQEIVGGLKDGDKLDAKGSVSVDVKVTNTGSVAGKEVVQLYMTAPYTDYDKANGIEKSEVVLVAYGKTGELQPGASETVTVTFKMEDVASYDNTHDNGDGTKGSYMLDAGNYIFSIRENAHVAIASVTASMDKDFFYSGQDQRESDDQAAYNQFDSASRGEYLSRQNSFANYASAMASVSNTVKTTDWEDTRNAYDSAYDSAVSKTYKEGVDYAASGSLTISDLAGVEYDDPLWDEIMKQLTVDDMSNLVLNAMYSVPAIESVGKASTSQSDGPLGISSMFNADVNSIAYPCMIILASTFNDELANRYGSYMADQSHDLGITGWYAPAMNTHRTAYSGRNFEYFSEDATLSAGIAAAEVSGARAKGLVVYIKHFALNDQETRRSGNLHTYSNEQAIRENYLKPFEAAVKIGGATAVMTAMNYVGDEFAGGNKALLTEVLRNEWGFRGACLSDMDEGGEIVGVDECMRAGLDSWLGMGRGGVTSATDADIYYLQRAAKNVLYMEANAAIIATEIVNWHAYLTYIYVELILLIAICISVIVINVKRNKK